MRVATTGNRKVVRAIGSCQMMVGAANHRRPFLPVVVVVVVAVVVAVVVVVVVVVVAAALFLTGIAGSFKAFACGV